jgi:hypothetical protein
MSTYRYKINTRYIPLTGGTIDPMNNPATGSQEFKNYLTVFKNGSAFSNKTTLFTRQNVYEDPKSIFEAYRDSIKNNIFIPISTNNFISSGTTIVPNLNYKNINIPFEIDFDVVDYSDDIQGFIGKEIKKNTNKIIDGERIKYISETFPNTVKIKFRFYDKDNELFDDTNLNGGYNLAGFIDDEINKKNNFKKSYFRLYFFDSNDTKTQNLLTTEDIDVYGSLKPDFIFDRIYWLKNDELFLDTLDDRLIFMEARFFNAKTGRVHRFMNTPNVITTPISISNFSNNLEWKSSQLLIINPKNNNNNRYFRIIPGIGANTTNEITLTEYILQT